MHRDILRTGRQPSYVELINARRNFVPTWKEDRWHITKVKDNTSGYVVVFLGDSTISFSFKLFTKMFTKFHNTFSTDVHGEIQLPAFAYFAGYRSLNFLDQSVHNIFRFHQRQISGFSDLLHVCSITNELAVCRLLFVECIL